MRKDAKFCEDLCRWRYHYYKKEGKEEKIERIRSRGQQVTENQEGTRIRTTRYKSPSLKETLDIVNKL